MKFYRIAAVLLLSLNLTSAFAQWSGSVNADGAWNFLKSNNENADVKLKYNSNNFYVGSGLNFGHSFLPSSQVTSILDAKKEKDQYYKGESKTIDPRKFKAGANLDFGYKFDPLNVLDASVSYSYNSTDEKSLLNSERYTSNSATGTEGTQKDTLYANVHNFVFSTSYVHGFDSRPGARLGVTASSASNLKSESNRRVTFGNFYSRDKNYATYSSLNAFNSNLSVFYEDAFRLGSDNLKLKAGTDFVTNQDIDAYAAENYVNGEWRDSTQYRQSYFYSALSTEPYVNLTYTLGKFDFFVKERVQVYWHAMLNKLEDIQKPGEAKSLFDKVDARNLLSAGITYRINDFHRVTVDYGRSISRPDYKKLCPTLMIGKSEGEYFIGNPGLLPELTDKVNLSYSYKKGIFETRLDINYRDKRNTAEKVIDLEKSKDITDPMVKTLYTWVNSKRQNSFGTKLDLKIDGSSVKADIWAGFNYDTYWKNAKVDKNDFNYELGTIVDVFLTKTTKLSSSLVYVSAKHSAYNMKGEDVLANLRFSQIVTAGLELYAEFKDIVDKEVYEETWNADMNYLKLVSTKPNHRAMLLGVKYVF
ncbi:MAG: outer membrane beta-barrel protein [Bacteroidales bacterium]|nr:outer membrane beta-barrel protein [Bacteroidales bacterium]